MLSYKYIRHDLFTNQCRVFLAIFPIPRVEASSRTRSPLTSLGRHKEYLQRIRCIMPALEKQNVYDSSYKAIHWASKDAVNSQSRIHSYVVPGHRNVSRKYGKSQMVDAATKLLANTQERNTMSFSLLFTFAVKCSLPMLG